VLLRDTGNVADVCVLAFCARCAVACVEKRFEFDEFENLNFQSETIPKLSVRPQIRAANNAQTYDTRNRTRPTTRAEQRKTTIRSGTSDKLRNGSTSRKQ